MSRKNSMDTNSSSEHDGTSSGLQRAVRKLVQENAVSQVSASSVTSSSVDSPSPSLTSNSGPPSSIFDPRYTTSSTSSLLPPTEHLQRSQQPPSLSSLPARHSLTPSMVSPLPFAHNFGGGSPATLETANSYFGMPGFDFGSNGTYPSLGSPLPQVPVDLTPGGGSESVLSASPARRCFFDRPLTLPSHHTATS